MAEKIIKKRDGRKEPFDFNKIKKALNSAFKAVQNRECPKAVLVYAEFVADKYDSVEEIQDAIEKVLMEKGYYNVAKAYILYREQHKHYREESKKRWDFIENFVHSDNAANATIDDNSNVNNHNIAVLNAEIHKEDNMRTNMYIWEKEVKKLYPDFNIKQMREDFKTILYPHDASSQVLMPYCMAVSMYPYIMNGLKDLGGKSAVPKSLESFCGIYVNLIFALASEVKGAVATPEVLMYFDYFARKEWGNDYYNNLDKLATGECCKNPRTIRKQIHQYFQQIVYSINQVSSSRGAQCPFTNFSFFDKYFFEGMFGDFVFPDGTKPIWESTNFLQKEFLHWFNQDRLKCINTFPVCSYACLIENGEFKDRSTFEFICKEYSEGNSFFTYLSESVDSLSSCCFSKDQKVLWKSSTGGVNLTTLEELYNTKWEPDKKNLRIFHNGSWVAGKAIKLPNRKMYKVVTENNKELLMTDNHINVTLTGEKLTKELTTNDYLMFNTLPLNSIPETDEHLTYEQGFTVGAFLGDGSFGGSIKDTIYDINFSQNINKYRKLMEMVDIANKQLGHNGTTQLAEVYNNVYPVRISSEILAAFIMKWTNWKRGVYAWNKELNLDCLTQSIEFRKGILDGWYNTDGGNSNRCYTTSCKLAECMEALITSLGMQSIINISDRIDESVIIRDEIWDRNYPLYCVRWYEQANHRVNKNKSHSWIKKNNSIYFKIKSIEEIEYLGDVYCIECANIEEPYFTLPNGIITHNCRLQNAVKENTFNFTNGQLGVITGSKNVITLNLNRIIQDFRNSYSVECCGRDGIPSREFFKSMWRDSTTKEDFKEYLINILERVYMYHKAYNSLLHWAYNHHLFNAYKAGFINLDKQYLTIGINGLNQAAEFVGLECNNNKDYQEFCKFIFSTIKEQNTLHKTKSEMYNTEEVPAESASIKLYNRDKVDGYWVPNDTNLYASYIFKPNDNSISILDKITLHSSKFAANELDGGVAAHLNLEEHLSEEQYKKLLRFAAKEGCKYFTFNVPNCECEDCGFIAKQPFDKCPKCNSTNVSLWDRVIGYLTKIKNWSKGRQDEQKLRVYGKYDA